MRPPSTQVRALLTLAAFLLMLGAAAPVYAHANLIRSDPPANSVLSTSPHEITLYFTEQVEPKLSGAAVYDATGKEVDTGYSVNPNDDTIIVVSLPTLSAGVYTVSWHAISAVDGHHTSGSFSFGIGNVTIPVQEGNGNAYAFPSSLEVIERWMNLLADALFVGGGAFVLLVLNPTLTMRSNFSQDRTRRVYSRLARLLGFSAIIAIGGTTLLLVVQATAASTSTSLPSTIAAAYLILMSTRIGEYWTLRVAVVSIATAASIILIKQKNASNRGWGLVAIIGVLLSLSTSLTSHNAASTNYYPVINLLSDWIHLVGAGIWVGGLAYLAIAVASLSSIKLKKLVSELLRRFSSVAIVCLGAIGVTGMYNFVIEVGSLTAFLTTGYGRILLLKIAIFAPMIVFGALNQLVFYDHIVDAHAKTIRTNRGKPAYWLRKFKLSLRTEMTLGTILLLVVGLLTASAPVAQTLSSASQYQPAPTVLYGSSTQDINVSLKVFPYQVGDNHFEIDFTNPQGAPVTDVRSVFMKFKYLDRNLGVSIANATDAPAQGIYTLDGTYLSFSGNWQVEVWAQRNDGFDVIVAFQFNLPEISSRFSELPLSTDANPYGISIDQNGAVWFAETGSGSIARYDQTTGTLNEFRLPQAGSRPFYIAIDNHGIVWTSETQYNQIVSFDPSTNHFRIYPVQTSGAVPGGITVDRDGNIWFTEELANKIGRLNPATGTISEFTIPTENSIPIQITTDPSGSIWFTESKAGKIGRINPQTVAITEFQPKNETLLGPTGITTSPGGTIWFTEHAGNRITEFDPQNQIFHTYPIPSAQAFPFGIAFHANRLWFVEHLANSIGSLDIASGVFNDFRIPNNSSDIQLLSVDQSGNVWFTLPASNVLGVLTSTSSTLQLIPSANDSSFALLAAGAAVIIGSACALVLFSSQRRMRRKALVRKRQQV